MEFSCMFLNIKNIQSNYFYAQQVISENLICYFCETWLSELDKGFLDNLSTTSTYVNKTEHSRKTVWWYLLVCK